MIADGAAMDDGPGADGTVIADVRGVMDHGIVLNVGAGPHLDGAVVAPEDGTVPDIHIGLQRYVSHDGGVGGKVDIV